MTLQEVLLKNAGQHIYHRNGVIKNYSIEIDPGGNIATLRSSDNLPFQIIINLRSKLLNLKRYDKPYFVGIDIQSDVTGNKYYFYIIDEYDPDGIIEQKKRIGDPTPFQNAEIAASVVYD